MPATKNETSARLIEGVGSFLQRFNEIGDDLKTKQQEWEETEAQHFNIFRVLRIDRRETKLHSRFLAELLSPSGPHSQGRRFLDAFLEMGKKIGLDCPSERPKNLVWEIFTEEVIKKGRLDIVVRCQQARFIMAIENKIDAGERDNQLSDYDDWLDDQDAQFKNLVFLTPDGREPNSISKTKCICLSYRDHISDWLKQALSEIKAPKLKWAVEQYQQVVEEL